VAVGITTSLYVAEASSWVLIAAYQQLICNEKFPRVYTSQHCKCSNLHLAQLICHSLFVFAVFTYFTSMTDDVDTTVQ